jgi:haloacetate dehalogenase
MAAELVTVMGRLGHDRFAVAGHDRGGRVAYRLALDHPGSVTRLATLDIVPTVEQWEQMNGTAGVYGFHWQFLAQPHPFPERFIEADPEYWLRTLCSRWAADPAALEEAMSHYVAAFDAETIRASCDDYRAGATIDVRLDTEDRAAGRRITCPMLALWGDPSGRRPPLDEVWRRWADDVTGRALPCGHFLPEEAPAETLAALTEFLVEG